MTTTIDHTIAHLIAYLQANGVRHLSIFTDDDCPRIYVSGPTYRGPEANAATLSEAVALLTEARRDIDLLETLY